MHANDEPFIHKYDAQWQDLTPRDVAVRSMYHEMLTHDLPNVSLDLRSYILDPRSREHFPTIPRLERALSELRHLETVIERFYRTTALTDSVIGLRNAVRTFPSVIVCMDISYSA